MNIPIETLLTATAEVSIQKQNKMGVFNCELRWPDEPKSVKPALPQDGLFARAALNVYLKDAEAV